VNSASALANAATEEHASIAAFARTICQLLALGAPAWLIAETQRALADEIRHTAMTLDLVEEQTGERPTIGALPSACAAIDLDPASMFRDVFRGGAVGETRAAVEAERDALVNPELRPFYETIAHDEARHAALAFKTLQWLLETFALEAVRDEEIARIGEDDLLTPLFEALTTDRQPFAGDRRPS
jgi:hypothetical protein